MLFDYRKEYREFYLPENKPEIVDVPGMKFIAVRGGGNPMMRTENTRLPSVCFMELLLQSK